MKRRFNSRSAPKQAFHKTKYKQECWCKAYATWEDVEEYSRRDYKASEKLGYDPKTGKQIYAHYKQCPRCRGKKWFWRSTKELLYQCFGGPLNGQFKSMVEAGDDYTQYNRAMRAGVSAQRAILVWDGGHIAVPE